MVTTTSITAVRVSTRSDHATWKHAVEKSDVRLQWDPDHAPDGGRLARRAVQLGLRGSALRELAEEALLEVIDMTGFVEEQRKNASSGWEALSTPTEHVYSPAGRALASLDTRNEG